LYLFNWRREIAFKLQSILNSLAAVHFSIIKKIIKGTQDINLTHIDADAWQFQNECRFCRFWENAFNLRMCCCAKYNHLCRLVIVIKYERTNPIENFSADVNCYKHHLVNLRIYHLFCYEHLFYAIKFNTNFK